MPVVTSESTDRFSGRDIPEKDGAIAAARDKGRVVVGDGEGENFVAMRGIRLD